MPRGERYIVGGTLGLYTTASDAINRRNRASDLKDNWNSVEGDGTPYINSFSGWQNYHPAVPIWWVPSWGGSGYEIGWVNDNDNYQATQPSVTPATTTMGNTMTINLPRNHPDIYHAVTYSFNGQSGTISSNAGTSATWTPPLSLASKIPNSSTGTGTITAKTYGGGRLVGTKTCSFAVAVPSSVVPTISHSIAEATAGLATKFGAYIQSKSKLKVTNTAAGAYGSTIKSIVTEVEKKTYSGGTITTSVIGGSGSIVVKTTVTDSRGRTAIRSTTESVLAYTAPRILRFSAWRANSAGNTLDDGTFARVSQRFEITNLNSKNDKTWKVEYRQVGTSTWIQLDSGSVYAYDSAFNSINAILSTESSYELRLTISDYFTSVAASTTVGTAYTLLDFNASGKGLALGKVSEKDAFEVVLPAEFSNVDFTMPNGRRAVYSQATSNMNDVVEEWVLGTNGSNYPDSGYWYVHTIMHSNSNQRKQIAYGYTNDDVYTRRAYEGTWSPWRKVYHTGNLPSFAPTSHNHSGADITSGTVPVARLGMTVSKAVNGYVKLPDGVIIQWGNVTVPSGSYSTSLTFPLAFPSACRSIVGNWQTNTSYTEAYVVSFTSPSTTSATVYCRRADSTVDFGRVVRWIAMGY